MANHRLIVAGGFRVAGWVLGLPALLAAIWLGVGAFTFTHLPAEASPYLSVQRYGLVGLLTNSAHAAASALVFLGHLAGWLLGMLAVLALFTALFGVLLELTGRGLWRAAAWARALAIVICAIGLLNGLGALALLPRGAAMADGVMIAIEAYALWVLGWRFADPPPA
jgi:uncharacterized membrane protein (DUF2068 family)